jgi:hypothetical protein
MVKLSGARSPPELQKRRALPVSILKPGIRDTGMTGGRANQSAGILDPVPRSSVCCHGFRVVDRSSLQSAQGELA